MKRQKEKSPYGLLALLAVLLGLGIQLAMGRADHRRETAEAERILAELGDRAERAAEEELLTRRLQQAAGEDRAADFSAGRRAAAESGDPTLLILVNQWNQLPEDYAPELELVAELDGRRYELDRRCSEALWDMLADCAAAGGRPYICSAYRSAQDQQKLYQDKVRRLEKEGVSREEAPELPPSMPESRSGATRLKIELVFLPETPLLWAMALVAPLPSSVLKMLLLEPLAAALVSLLSSACAPFSIKRGTAALTTRLTSSGVVPVSLLISFTFSSVSSAFKREE